VKALDEEKSCCSISKKTRMGDLLQVEGTEGEWSDRMMLGPKDILSSLLRSFLSHGLFSWFILFVVSRFTCGLGDRRECVATSKSDSRNNAEIFAY